MTELQIIVSVMVGLFLLNMGTTLIVAGQITRTMIKLHSDPPKEKEWETVVEEESDRERKEASIIYDLCSQNGIEEIIVCIKKMNLIDRGIILTAERDGRMDNRLCSALSCVDALSLSYT